MALASRRKEREGGGESSQPEISLPTAGLSARNFRGWFCLLSFQSRLRSPAGGLSLHTWRPSVISSYWLLHPHRARTMLSYHFHMLVGGTSRAKWLRRFRLIAGTSHWPQQPVASASFQTCFPPVCKRFSFFKKFLLKFFFFNRSRIDLQWCVSLVYSKAIQLYTYILFQSFPL